MKNPRIAFLLGLLPLLQGGCGMLSIWGPADYLHVGGLLLFFAFTVYIILGLHSFRMVNVGSSDAPFETFSAERSAIHVVAISQKPHPMGSFENGGVLCF